MAFSFQTAVGLAFAVMAIAVILHALWNILTALESRKWPAAAGVILSSRVEEKVDAQYIYTRAVVSYRFNVGGEELVGRRACFGDVNSSTMKFLARRIVDRYRAGQAVTVRYNPTKPQECVLEPGVSAHLLLELLLGCAFFIVAIFVLRAAG